MNTDNGTDWDKVGNAIIIYHTNEEAPQGDNSFVAE